MKAKSSGWLNGGFVCTTLSVLSYILGEGLILIGSSQHPVTSGGRVGQAAGHVFISLIGGLAFFTAASIAVVAIFMYGIYLFHKDTKNRVTPIFMILFSIFTTYYSLAHFISLIRN